ncbi:hypothetical protein [Defluviimonas salinarum]|uniref:Uncharacterized protein n=1 Tax=Defluviimonas salinarum TaxID=2992147 RepID=A0ABT3J1J1_9RHOB|nr:hypothetical protein [Defluviimonas salinarum]MCW3781557.1 hypothetical protein [Defluviimonas salinarum]
MNSDQRHALLEKYTSEVIFVAVEIKECIVDAVGDHTEGTFRRSASSVWTAAKDIRAYRRAKEPDPDIQPRLDESRGLLADSH